MKKRADDGLAFLLKYENIAWYEDGKVRILDRRIYPIRTEYVICNTYQDVAQAIGDMVTQSGGPYTAAAMGMVLAANQALKNSQQDILLYLKDAAYALSHARPTTSARMEKVVEGALRVADASLSKGCTGSELINDLSQYAVNHLEMNYRKYDFVAKYLADHIPENGTIMTQCFAETIIGTLIRECHRRGNNIHMICAETRPYFQGSRLTASVAENMGVDVTVITDNMPGYVLHKKHVDLFTSAADVITMDGYIVNKIGTFQIALCADYWNIPYFVTGTPNQSHSTIQTVTIEERDPEETNKSLGTRVTLPGVKGYYPAFDITPPKLCDGVVTDRGVFSPFDLQAYFCAPKPNLEATYEDC